MSRGEVVCAIVSSALGICSVTCADWSATTETPGCDCGSYPFFVALTVYVSGPSEMNENRPAASVIVCAVCDGEFTTTSAPAIGAPLGVSTTLPVKRAGRTGLRREG